MIKLTLIHGHVLNALKLIPDNSIDCIITSPPYWGLRKYPDDANVIWDGSPNCQHEWEIEEEKHPLYREGLEETSPKQSSNRGSLLVSKSKFVSGFCKKCGAWFGQLGLEPSLELYIEHLLQITKELKRVLKPTGVMFWNMGDNYVGKCMAMQNYRLILRMIDEQGWILRNIIIWYKPNHMPSSVKDRFTNAYEPIFMLTKSKKYYFDLDAVREPIKTDINKIRFNYRVREAKKGHFGIIGVRASEEEMKKYDNQGRLILKERSGKFKDVKVNSPGGREWYIVWQRKLPPKEEIYEYLKFWKEKRGLSLEDIKKFFGDKGDKVSHWFSPPDSKHGFAYPSAEDWLKLKELLKFDDKYDEAMTKTYPFYVDDFGKKELDSPNTKSNGKYNLDWDEIKSNPETQLTLGGMGRFYIWQKKVGRIDNYPLGKNPGDVWVINTQPFKGAHFATFPEELVRRCILAGCPKEVCKKCGKPRKRIGWTDCGCNAGFEPGVVLDPFLGSGTTMKVARELGVNCIGIEIVEEYCKMTMKRLNWGSSLGNIIFEFKKV